MRCKRTRSHSSSSPSAVKFSGIEPTGGNGALLGTGVAEVVEKVMIGPDITVCDEAKVVAEAGALTGWYVAANTAKINVAT